jgi:hypothetical protein
MLPGLESAGTAALPRLAALERLLARGRARALGVSPWDFLADQAGGSLARWPVGPLSALGELGDPPRACLRIEPLGAELEQQGLFRLPAAGLGIGMDEAHALAQSFDETFASDGLRLQIATPERWYLCWDEAQGGERDWRGCAGPALAIAHGARPAPPEAALRRLMSEVEMLFHAHPVNAIRRERGAPIIAGLHPWGGGRLPDGLPGAAADAVTPGEPYLAGLRRIGVLAGAAPLRVDDAALPPDGVAWPLAIECLDGARLAAEGEAWAAPLARLLRRGRLAGIRIVTGRAIHEVRRLDALRFWRRPRPVGES